VRLHCALLPTYPSTRARGPGGNTGRGRLITHRRSIVTAKEALAISTLGVDHITISGAVLEALAKDQYAQDFRGSALEVDVPAARVPEGGKGEWAQGITARQHSAVSRLAEQGSAVHPNVDFLANAGAALDESIGADESVKRRLDYAIKWVIPLLSGVVRNRGQRNRGLTRHRAFADCEAKAVEVIRSLL
jgi:hypothetical protein